MIDNLSVFYSSNWGILLQVAGALASVAALTLTGLVALAQLELLPLSWRAAIRATNSLMSRMSADNWWPDLIICLGRSGGIWGGYIAGNLGSKPAFMVMDNYSPDRSYVEFEFIQQLADVLKEKSPKRVLVVHGYSGTGGTFFLFRDALSKRATLKNIDFRFGSVFAWKGCRFKEKHFVGRFLRRPATKMPWHTTNQFVTAMGTQ